MKKYFWGLSAILLAVAVTSFTTIQKIAPKSKFAVVYLNHTGSAVNQNQVGEYSQQTNQPSACNQGTTKLCWIEVQEINTPNGVIDATELDAFFTTYDSDNDDSLDDQAEQTLILEKKS
jgi:hypothetical protein